MACSVKSVKLSVIGLSCLQKLISHDAVASSALKEILATLRDVSFSSLMYPLASLFELSIINLYICLKISMVSVEGLVLIVILDN